ncbi:aminotransferase class V-fold PLP-dependent enzyme [Sphingomonas crocodyli]|uniref:Aminotransferase class V-fold PLP-dependent enzyme n=1 Tax=Sphingomonas crocodyli TaxID=1979270 RepID=A0A437LUV1_9SPHN|nr:aminotransferase class V-fold PLP-dependent enzyme [Sphingomonas crocodyli]RVT89156.1 aminotransferase class V-fold PLP-dependent enzyme [Sphingomonas crocodyli]
MPVSRRTFLAASAAASAAPAFAETLAVPAGITPDKLAADEAWWAQVAKLYDAPPPGIVQLEAGHFGAMQTTVRQAYEARTDKVNRETTLFTRGPANAEMRGVRTQVAALLKLDPAEIAFTRGGSESMAVLIGGYNKLMPGDAVLYADLDYDAMQTGMESLARLRGVRVVKIDLPEPATAQSLVDAYEAALKADPKIRMMLLTQLSHRTGLVPPVKEIVAMAKARNIDVLLDVGHALGQLDFSLKELGIEFAGINLHKWIAAPLGVGVVYIGKDRIPDIDPSLLEAPSDRIDARIHTGTVNFAGILTVPDAIAAHQRIGIAAKAARLRHLRDLWVKPLRGVKGIEILTPDDPALHGGITSFRLTGRTSIEANRALRQALFDRHRIFTIERDGPAKGCCVRVSPSFTNNADDMAKLVAALHEIAAEG